MTPSERAAKTSVPPCRSQRTRGFRIGSMPVIPPEWLGWSLVNASPTPPVLIFNTCLGNVGCFSSSSLFFLVVFSLPGQRRYPWVDTAVMYTFFRPCFQLLSICAARRATEFRCLAPSSFYKKQGACRSYLAKTLHLHAVVCSTPDPSSNGWLVVGVIGLLSAPLLPIYCMRAA